MKFYQAKNDMVCGAKGTLYTAAELKKYQLNKAKFEQVDLPESATEVWCGVRTKRKGA